MVAGRMMNQPFRFTLPLALIAAVLSGCYSDQTQALATCRNNAESRVDQSTGDVAQMEISDAITLCMEASGYERIEEECPKSFRTASVVRGKTYEQTSREIKMLENMQKNEPSCYAPIKWYGKAMRRLEKALSLAPSYK